MKKIILYPDEVWSYIVTNKSEFYENDIIIAYDDDNSIRVLLSCAYDSTDEYPFWGTYADDITLYVEVDGEKENYGSLGYWNCEDIVDEVYTEYGFNEMRLTDMGVPLDNESLDGIPQEDLQELIDFREEDLTNIVKDMICVALDEYHMVLDDEKIEEIKDDILEYLAGVFPNESVYRPMFIKDGNVIKFEEYPYK